MRRARLRQLTGDDAWLVGDESGLDTALGDDLARWAVALSPDQFVAAVRAKFESLAMELALWRGYERVCQWLETAAEDNSLVFAREDPRLRTLGTGLREMALLARAQEYGVQYTDLRALRLKPDSIDSHYASIVVRHVLRSVFGNNAPQSLDMVSGYIYMSSRVLSTRFKELKWDDLNWFQNLIEEGKLRQLISTYRDGAISRERFADQIQKLAANRRTLRETGTHPNFDAWISALDETLAQELGEPLDLLRAGLYPDVEDDGAREALVNRMCREAVSVVKASITSCVVSGVGPLWDGFDLVTDGLAEMEDTELAGRLEWLETLGREQFLQTHQYRTSLLAKEAETQADDTDLSLLRRLQNQAKFDARHLNLIRVGRLAQLAEFTRTEIQESMRVPVARASAASDGPPTLLPSLFRQAGQAIAPRGAALKWLTAVAPTLAERVAGEGIYVTRYGTIDLSPYAAHIVQGNARNAVWPTVSIRDIGLDQALPVDGREWAALESSRRALATLRAVAERFGVANPDQALAEVRMQYNASGRFMVAVPAALVALAARLDSRFITSNGVIRDLQPENIAEPGDVRWPTRLTVSQPELASTRTPIRYDRDALGNDPVIPEPEAADGGGGVTADQVTQGALGDCGLIASMRAVARLRPGTIAQAIRDNGDGTWTVTLHVPRPLNDRWLSNGTIDVTVTSDIAVLEGEHHTSDGRSTAFARPANGANWGPIVEKAMTALTRVLTDNQWAGWQVLWNQDHPSAVTTNYLQAMPDGYRFLGTGSVATEEAEFLVSLTGETAAISSFPDPSELTPAAITKTTNELRALLEAGCPIIVSTRAHAPGLTERHAYSVVEVTEQGMVQLDDPHGEQQPEKMTVEALVKATWSEYAHLALSPAVVSAAEIRRRYDVHPYLLDHEPGTSLSEVLGRLPDPETNPTRPAVDCVLRLVGLVRGLYPLRVAIDDSAVVVGPEELLAATVGGNLRVTDDLDGLVERLRRLGPGSMALIVSGRPGAVSHGWALRVAHDGAVNVVNPQAAADQAITLYNADDPNPATRFGGMPYANARYILVNAQGRAVGESGLTTTSTADALIDAAMRRAGAPGPVATPDRRQAMFAELNSAGETLSQPGARLSSVVTTIARAALTASDLGLLDGLLDLDNIEAAGLNETAIALVRMFRAEPGAEAAALTAFQRDVIAEARRVTADLVVPGAPATRLNAAVARILHAVATGSRRDDLTMGGLLQEFLETVPAEDRLALAEDIAPLDTLHLDSVRLRARYGELLGEIDGTLDACAQEFRAATSPTTGAATRLAICERARHLIDWYRAENANHQPWQVLASDISEQARAFLNGLVLPTVEKQSISDAVTALKAHRPTEYASLKAMDYANNLVVHPADSDPRNGIHHLAAISDRLWTTVLVKRLETLAAEGGVRQREIEQALTTAGFGDVLTGIQENAVWQAGVYNAAGTAQKALDTMLAALPAEHRVPIDNWRDQRNRDRAEIACIFLISRNLRGASNGIEDHIYLRQSLHYRLYGQIQQLATMPSGLVSGGRLLDELKRIQTERIQTERDIRLPNAPELTDLNHQATETFRRWLVDTLTNLIGHYVTSPMPEAVKQMIVEHCEETAQRLGRAEALRDSPLWAAIDRVINTAEADHQPEDGWLVEQVRQLGALSGEHLLAAQQATVSQLAETFSGMTADQLSDRSRLLREEFASLTAINFSRRHLERRGRLEQLSTFAQDVIDRAVSGPLERSLIEGSCVPTDQSYLPSLAGQDIWFDDDTLDRLEQISGFSDVFEWIRDNYRCLYVNLHGLVDPATYGEDGFDVFDLGEIGSHYDPSNPRWRERLALDDRRAAYGHYHATHPNSYELREGTLQYVGNGREMLLVSAPLARLLNSLTPNRITAERVIIDDESDSTTTGGTSDLWTPAETNVGEQAQLMQIDRPIGYNTPAQSPPLFAAPEVGITAEQVSQGKLGNCGLIAALRATARHMPDRIRDVVTPGPDEGNYVVKLPRVRLDGDRWTVSEETVTITVRGGFPVDESGNFVYARPHGALWGVVIEDALAMLNQAWTPQEYADWQSLWERRHAWQGMRGRQAAPTGYYQIGSGSVEIHQAGYLARLTGRPATVSTFPSVQDLADEGQAEALRQKLRQLLSENSPIIVGFHRYSRLVDDRLLPDHSCEIIGVTDTGMIEISNPWGEDVTPTLTMSIQKLVDATVNQYVHLLGDAHPTDSDTTHAHLASVSSPSHGLYRVTTLENHTFSIRVSTTDLRRLSNHGSHDIVARSTRTPNSAHDYAIQISEHLNPRMVSEALAHELRELAAEHDAGPAKRMARAIFGNRLTSWADRVVDAPLATPTTLAQTDLRTLGEHNTDLGYEFVNRALRDPCGYAPEFVEEMRERADALSAVLSRMPSRPRVTWRGVGFTGSFTREDFLARYRVGEVIVEAGFTSTTRYRELVETGGAFAGDASLVVEGSHGRDVGAHIDPDGRVATDDGFTDSGEVLYDQGTRFLVRDVHLDPVTNHPTVTLYEVVAVEGNPTPERMDLLSAVESLPGVVTGVRDCVVRLDALHRRLYGGGVGGPVDDSVVGVSPERGFAERLGTVWSPVDDLATVERWVRDNPGWTAFLLGHTPGGDGHGIALHHDRTLGPVVVETQAVGDARIRRIANDGRFPLDGLPVSQRRVIVVDETGHPVNLGLITHHTSATSIDALTDPGDTHDHGMATEHSGDDPTLPVIDPAEFRTITERYLAASASAPLTTVEQVQAADYANSLIPMDSQGMRARIQDLADESPAMSDENIDAQREQLKAASDRWFHDSLRAVVHPLATAQMLTDAQVQELCDGLSISNAKSSGMTLRLTLHPWGVNRTYSAVSASIDATSRRSQQDADAEQGLNGLAEAIDGDPEDLTARFAELIKTDVGKLTDEVRSNFKKLAEIDAKVRLQNTQTVLQQLIHLSDQVTDDQLQHLASDLLDEQQMRVLHLRDNHLRSKIRKFADSIPWEYTKSIYPILGIRLRQMAAEATIETSEMDEWIKDILNQGQGTARRRVAEDFTDAQVDIVLRIRREQWGNTLRRMDGEALVHELRQLSILRDRINHEPTRARLRQLATTSNEAVLDYLSWLDRHHELTSDNLAGIDTSPLEGTKNIDDSLHRRLRSWRFRYRIWMAFPGESGSRAEARDELFAELEQIYRDLGTEQARTAAQLRDPVDRVDDTRRAEHFTRWAAFDEALADSAFRGRIDQLIARWNDGRPTDELRTLTEFGASQIANGRENRLKTLYTFSAADLNTALQPQRARLIVEGRNTTGDLSQLAHLAGAIIRLNPTLASLTPQTCIYVNTRGRFDLTICAAHFRDSPCQPVLLGEIGPNLTQSDPVTQAWLRYNDNRRATAAFCFRYGRYDTNGNLTISDDVHSFLGQNPLRYVGDGRSMLPIPETLLAALTKVDLSRVIADGTIPDEQPEQSVVSTDSQRLRNSQPLVSLVVDHPEPMAQFGEPIHPATVFGELPVISGRPSPVQVTQGNLRDCGLIASLRAIARNGLGDLAGMIRDNGNGTYTVRLHEAILVGNAAIPTRWRMKFTVTASVPHDPQGAVLYARPHEALWGAILKKAMTGRDQRWSIYQHIVSYQDWSRQYHSQAGSGDPIYAAPTGYHHIGNGSFPLEQALYLAQLTGRTAVVREFPEHLLQQLNSLLKNKNPIIVGTKSSASLRDAGLSDKAKRLRLITAHAYEVVGAAGNQVILSNPHGTNDPAPIDIEDFQSLFTPVYAHLDLPVRPVTTGMSVPQSSSSRDVIPTMEGSLPPKTVMGIPGTRFTVAFASDAAPSRVLAAATTLLDSLSSVEGEAARELLRDAARVSVVEPRSDGRYQITTLGNHTFLIRVATGDLRRISNQSDQDFVASFTRVRGANREFVIQVSEHLDPEVVPEAVARVLRELTAEHDAGPLKRVVRLLHGKRLTSHTDRRTGVLSAHDQAGLHTSSSGPQSSGTPGRDMTPPGSARSTRRPQ